MTGTPEMEAKVKRWWFWFGTALFLFVPLDLLLTLIAVAEYGIAVEANPLFRWLLYQGLFTVVVVHLIVVGFLVSMFHGVIEIVRSVSERNRHRLSLAVSICLSVWTVAGLVLVTNNFLALLQ